MVRKELISIKIVNEKFDDFVSKVKKHGPDFRFAERTKKACPKSLISRLLSPSTEHGVDDTETIARESTKVL
jgi:hypothetical protein